MKTLLKTGSAATLTLVLSACATPTPLALKPTDVPAAFSEQSPPGTPVWPSAGWWEGFKSDELNGLETAAQSDNLDLAVAMAQVLEAEANTTIAGSVLFPQIDAEGTGVRQGSKKFVQATPQGPVVSGGTANAFGATLNASYQLDIWGKARDDLESARESLKAAQYAQEAVALTVVGDVADTYFDVLALRQRISIANQNLAAAQRILTITQAKVTNGISSNLDLAQQQALVASVQAEIPPLVEEEKEALYALALLLGKPPEGFDVKGQTIDGVTIQPVQPGVPSELLERRPDVSQALSQLAAAHANLNASRAAFFPQIGLTGSGGYASTALNMLFKSQTFVWSIGADIVQTIFDGGNLIGQNELAYATEQELIADYRKAVLNAFSNTESALGQVSSYAQQVKALQDEVNAAAEAFRISELQYREGTVDLLNVLQAQQTLFSAQDELVQAKLAWLQSEVSLYNALGGGWSEAQNPDTTPTVGKHPDNYILPILPF